ncbi:hypothetical protein P3T18_000386 [Paraburkholderia sp. GAS199]|uniref:hypothetical protein n=1 Tax=Paraburkholderia sp. GAS199 TaxID=3035126 RepID=UPI003D1BB79A
MDSRTVFLLIAFVVVLALVRGLRFFAAKFFPGRPLAISLASSAVLAICVFAVVHTFDVPMFFDCLEHDSASSCMTLAAHSSALNR